MKHPPSLKRMSDLWVSCPLVQPCSKTSFRQTNKLSLMATERNKAKSAVIVSVVLECV